MLRKAVSLVVVSVVVIAGALLSSRAQEAVRERNLARNQVTLRIKLPQDGDVRLWVNGREADTDDQPAELTCVVRTQPLEVKNGAVIEHACDLRVMWEPNNYTVITRERKLKVRPGGEFRVDLGKSEPTDKPDDIVVRYVPTPDAVVDKLLDLANVGKGDVVFDLGCGDGRMVCRAIANRGAARGVGVDIDPERIADSRQTAEQYKVVDKVRWREGDVLKSIDDLAEASVVMLYMGDDIGARLAPILRQKLKPGSRVVSHRFRLGDWQPDKTIRVADPTRTNEEDHVDLHLWVVRSKATAPSGTPSGKAK